jgi:hypothetical protein
MYNLVYHQKDLMNARRPAFINGRILSTLCNHTLERESKANAPIERAT